jgi:ribonuclease HII
MGNSRGAVDLRGGLDEVGMGALAGPVLVAVVVFPVGFRPIEGVDDSKRVPSKKRLKLMPAIMKCATYVGMGWAGPKMVDDLGVAAAWQYAAKHALAHVPPHTRLIVDGVRAPASLPSNWKGKVEVKTKADALYWEVAAASIAAKVVRDLDMVEMASKFPSYGWAKNSGYGTPAHYAELKRVGPTPHHRMSFLKNMIKKGELPGPYAGG